MPGAPAQAPAPPCLGPADGQGAILQPVPETESKARSLSALYAIHQVKPQGNVGKDNPNNPQAEIDFHRG